MNKLYYEMPYEREVCATVTAIEGNMVFFDKTIFYPEGGGQPGDRGVFNGYEIVDTRKVGDEVAHIFNSTEGLSVGSEGKLVLDWDHRYAFMKRHSAQHLLSSIFFKTLSVGTVAVHLADEYVTIELDRKEIGKSDLLKVEDIANSLVRKGLRIEQRDLPRSEAKALHMRRSIKVDDDVVKVVFISGQDAVACGGVHVSSTSEIGEISFYGVEYIRGHLRTIWLVDSEAVRVRRECLDITNEVSVLLSSPREEIVSSLKARLGELEDARRRIRGLLNRRCDVLVLRDGEKKEFLYVGSDGHFTELKKILSLKGGGRNGLYQGSFSQDGRSLLEQAKEVIDGFKG